MHAKWFLAWLVLGMGVGRSGWGQIPPPDDMIYPEGAVHGDTADIVRNKPRIDSEPVDQDDLAQAHRAKLDQMGAELLAESMMHRLQPAGQSALVKLDPSFEKMAIAATDLGTYVRDQGVPSERLEIGYVQLTFRQRSGQDSIGLQLADAVLKSPGRMKPADVMGAALEITGGDVPLAALAVQTLLKEVKYQSIPTETYPKPTFIAMVGESHTMTRTGPRVEARSAKELMAKLVDLRPEGDRYFHDKLGPWYHAFGLLFVGTALSPDSAAIGAMGENAWRYFNIGSSWDPVKMEANRWAAEESYALGLLMQWQSNATLSKHRGWYVPRFLDKLTEAELEQILEDLRAMDKFLVAGGHPATLRKAVAIHIDRVEKELLSRRSPLLYCTSIRDAAGQARARPQMSVALFAPKRTIYIESLRVPRPAPAAGAPVPPTSGTQVLPPWAEDTPSPPKAGAQDDTAYDLWLRQITITYLIEGEIAGRFPGKTLTGAPLDGDVTFHGSVHGRRVTLEVTYPRERRDAGFPPFEAGTATLVFDSPAPPAPDPAPPSPPDTMQIFYPPGM